MATQTSAGFTRLGETIATLVTVDGTAAAPWAQRLREPGVTSRDLADAVHSLCALHGGMPGIVDNARDTSQLAEAHDWLDQSAAAFADERALLAMLIAAVGPLPSTPGAAASEAAIVTQRHALGQLARSDRTGCAIGAAAAFVIDWHPIRQLLDSVAIRLGIPLRPRAFADVDSTTAMLDRCSTRPGTERAITFGAQQLLAQHRGLWHLLEARASARRDG